MEHFPVGTTTGESESGSAYLFNVDSGTQRFELIADDVTNDDNFGHSVAIAGNTAIVGAPIDVDADPRSGSVYLFDVTSSDQLFKLTASDEVIGNRFGYAVAINGNILVVGAPSDDDNGERIRFSIPL